MGVLAAAVCTLGTATAASAVTPYVWSGGAEQWSVAGDWQGDVAPSGMVGVISLGDVNGGCAAPCHANDDVSGLATGELDVDLSEGYYDAGSDSLTINGNGGTPNLGIDATMPSGAPSTHESYSGDSVVTGGITLGADQTWDVAGYPGGVGLGVGTVTGQHTLDLELSDGATVTASSLDTGAITASGDGTVALNDYYDGIGFATNNETSLPAQGITLAGGASLNVDSAANVSSGPITVSGGSDDLQPIIDVGAGTGTGTSHDAALSVAGDMTLDQWADLFLDLDGPSNPGGYSSLSASGDLALNGATVYLEQGTSGDPVGCPALDPGSAFPIISTTGNGSITGDLTYFDTAGNLDTLAPGQTSAPIPLQTDYCPDTDSIAFLTYGTNAITATIVTAPTDGSGSPVISGNPFTGGSLTVTSPGSWSAYPASMTYSYQWFACTATNCSNISGATSSSFNPTSAQGGDLIGVAVTATNAVGSTVDDSNRLGPVRLASPALTPVWITPAPTTPAPTTTTPTTPAPTPTVPMPTANLANTAAEVSSALRTMVAHPSGKKAKATLVKHGIFKTSFDAPASGLLSIIWKTRRTTGKGTHKKHRTVVVATSSGRASTASTIGIEIHLTAAGKSLLKTSTKLAILATEKFMLTSGSSNSVTTNFILSG